MARPIKKGLDYFPLDTGFFDNIKVKELKGKCGSDGMMLFMSNI